MQKDYLSIVVWYLYFYVTSRRGEGNSVKICPASPEDWIDLFKQAMLHLIQYTAQFHATKIFI